MNPIIPNFDSIPLPAPVWLLKSLLLLTLVLHLLAMNMLFGGTWTALIGRIRAKGNANAHGYRLAQELFGYLPTLVPMTVTLGVAPLLFVQALYGHLVYTSSVVLAWYWWSVWILVILAYYSLYYLKFKAAAGKAVWTWVPYVAAICLLMVSFILSNNFNLAQQPARFSVMILESAKGCTLNTSDPTTIPRWLHIMVGAIAVSGVFLMWLGKKEFSRDLEFAYYKLKLGYKVFLIPTMANILLGFGYMMMLPREVMMQLMGRDLLGTLLWVAGVGLIMWAVPLLKGAVKRPESNALFNGTLVVVAAVAAMVILRDRVRDLYLKPYFTLDMPKVEPQVIPIVLFLVSFVIGLYGLYWLVRTYQKGSSAK